MLSRDDFKFVVQHAPLVAFDLIAANARGQILLGRRNNAPGRGSWMVPGGRIFKGETGAQALARVSRAELGRALALDEVGLDGVYDHIYDENHFDEPGWGAHYLVVALRVRAPVDDAPPTDQHAEHRFFDVEELRASPDVHPFTKSYFRAFPQNLIVR